MTDPALQNWIDGTHVSRRQPGCDGPLGPSLVPLDAKDPEAAWCGAARAVVTLMARRAATVGFEAGPSCAELIGGAVNLDRGLLRNLGPLDARGHSLLGVAAHEGAHLAWSSRRRRNDSPLFKNVHDLIEEERIERKAAWRIPALAYSLQRAREELLMVDSGDVRFLGALFALIRAPERILNAVWKRHEQALLSAIDALTPFPKTQAGVRVAAKRIAKLVPLHERREEIRVPCFGSRSGNESIDESLDATGESPSAWPPVEWSAAEAHPSGYEAVRGSVAAQAAALRQQLKRLLPAAREGGLRQGTLDRRRLWSVQIHDRIFEAAQTQREGVDLALILDLSGSMKGDHAVLAQRLSILLSEAAADLPSVRLDIYGHAADRPRGDPKGRQVTRIIRFATPACGRALALGHFPIQGNNRDAHALEVIGEDLRSRGSKGGRQRAAIVIADGIPHAVGFGGKRAIEATRNSLAELEKSWGPVVFVAVADHSHLRALVPGPYFVFDAKHAARDLSRMLGLALRSGRVR